MANNSKSTETARVLAGYEALLKAGIVKNISDFFQYYTGFDSRKVKQIQQERQDLRKEIGYLKKINDLLEKGIKK